MADRAVIGGRCTLVRVRDRAGSAGCGWLCAFRQRKERNGTERVWRIERDPRGGGESLEASVEQTAARLRSNPMESRVCP